MWHRWMCQFLVTLMEKQCFLVFRWSFLSQFLITGSGPCFVLCALVPHHTFRYLHTFDEISPEYPLFQTEHSQLSQTYLWEMLQCLDHFSGPLLGSLWHIHGSPVLRSPERGSALHVWPHQCWVTVKDLNLLATLGRK